jgi:hypothetical protein
MSGDIVVTIRDVELDVTYTYNPGSRGQMYGRPENCYPPEPASIEIERVTIAGDTNDIFDLLAEDAVTEIEETIKGQIDKEAANG